MDMTQLYPELYQHLEQGETAYIVSEYGSDGSISRELVSEDETGQLASLAALKISPDAVYAGPLITIKRPDESLVLIERFMAKPRLIILGGGHIGLALADIAYLTGFDTIVYDDRQSFANQQRFRTANTVVCDSFTNLAQHVSIKPSDFVVDVTRGHLSDMECMAVILVGTEPAYTGMIGSERRVAIVFDQLIKEGFDAERINRIHAPIGLKIGAQTPSEIAISIMAQIIEVKRTQQGGAGWLSGDLELIEEAALRGFVPEAIMTVLSTEGSVPTEIGCKLGLSLEGGMAGTIGGGAGEAEVLQIGRELIKQGGWRLYEADLTDTAEDEGMVCGGTLQVLIEKA